MNEYNIEDLWLVVVRKDKGAQTNHVWVAPSGDTGQRRIYRAAIQGEFPVAAVPVSQVFGTRLEPQAGVVQRVLRGNWFVALVQGENNLQAIAQVQSKGPDLAAVILEARGQDLRALLTQEEFLAIGAKARAILAGDVKPDRDLVAHPPRHTSDPLPSELKAFEFHERTDVWSKVRK